MFPDDDMGGVYYRVQADGIDARAANARLIAAAPDMYDALRALNAGARPSNWDDEEDEGCCDAWRQLDAAISRAEGRP